MHRGAAMIRTPDLFDWSPPPYRGEPPSVRHSTTSIAAAAQIKKAIGPLHKVILAHLKTCPEGATDEEMQFTLRMPANTQRPRRRELQLSGLIVDSGLVRQGKSGRLAVAWKLTSNSKGA